MLFFLPAFLGILSDAWHEFEFVTSLVQSGVLHPFRSGVLSLPSDVGLFAVL